MRKVDSAGLLDGAEEGRTGRRRAHSRRVFELGHITGAVNVPVDQLQTAAASWDRNARLRRLLRERRTLGRGVSR